MRDDFARLDAGEIDPFELDDLIHHYKRSARELWKFCGSSGSDWERAVRTLAFLRDSGEEPHQSQAGAASRARWASDRGAVGFLPKGRVGSADLVGLLSGGEPEDLADRATR